VELARHFPRLRWIGREPARTARFLRGAGDDVAGRLRLSVRQPVCARHDPVPLPEGFPAVSSAGDELMERATREIATRLDQMSRGGVKLGEIKHLQPETRSALRRLQPDAVDVVEQTLPIPNWNPRPKGVDALVRSSSGEPRFPIELKLRETYWTLWDAYKMIDALNVNGVEAAYLLVGASEKDWSATYGHCSQKSKTTELFAYGVHEHVSDQLFLSNGHAWYDCLWGGSGRPMRVPAVIRTVRVGNERMQIDGIEGSLRCVRVEAATQGWLEFSQGWYSGDWPLGVQPCEHYLGWRGIPRQRAR
jgi:hypothetical protein